MTIGQFAKAVGVSTATVSRTLNGRGRVSPTTRRMILERMAELGYTPNATAQRLVTGRSQTVLLDCGASPLLADLFVTELVHGIQSALERHDYGLLLRAPAGDTLRAVASGTVDGAILLGGDSTGEADVTPPAELAKQIAPHGCPCVVIGQHPVEPAPGIGSVVVGLESGAREAARMLVEQGHQRIGFISSMAEDNVREIFRDELARLGVPPSNLVVTVAGRTAEDGERVMRELLTLSERPTAVFTRTDTLAAGALRAARRLGIRVPEDVSLIGHDDVPFARLIDPPLTTVRVDCVRLGEAAARMLLRMLDDPGAAPAPQVFPTSLILRDSVVALPSVTT